MHRINLYIFSDVPIAFDVFGGAGGSIPPIGANKFWHMKKIKRIAEIRELLMIDAEEECISRTRDYLTASFYMEFGNSNYEVELNVDENWQCSSCSVYDTEKDVEDTEISKAILKEYADQYAYIKNEAYDKLEKERELYEQHEQSLMYDFLY